VTYNFQTGNNKMTGWRVDHNSLHVHAYKAHTVQALTPDDKPCRFQFAKDILSNVEAHENYLRRWTSSDETTFHVPQGVNHHNGRI
jgi:hypothetical protein